jgi:hypothetical protein
MAMRKIKSGLRNLYRVLMVKPNGEKIIMTSQEPEIYHESHMISEATLMGIIKADEYAVEVEPEMQQMLEQRVAGKDRESLLAKNSLAELFIPLFSLRHLELKMAGITLALIMMLGIGPAGNHSINRHFNPMFLADTLIDSSVLHIPAVYDSSLEMGQ